MTNPSSCYGKAKLVLFDLDGTLYLDGVPYPGAIELFQRLQKSDMTPLFLTNNSSMPPCDNVERLRRIGFPATPENVITSGHGTVAMLRAYGMRGKRLYILGTKRFRAWMASEGFPHEEEDPQALLVAFDKELDYAKLHAATRLVLKGVPVFATHPDPVCPPNLPDVGMYLECLKAARPSVVIQAIAGKPHKWLCQVLQERFQATPGEMVMVGDRLDTDIAFACNNGMRSVLVRNGEPMPPEGLYRPTIVVPHIRQMMDEFWPRNLGW
jgi:HAD superfamily hydrolase (TIGR01450 family)